MKQLKFRVAGLAAIAVVSGMLATGCVYYPTEYAYAAPPPPPPRTVVYEPAPPPVVYRPYPVAPPVSFSFGLGYYHHGGHGYRGGHGGHHGGHRR